MRQRLFDLQHEEPYLAVDEHKTLDRLRNLLLAAWVVVLFVALVFVIAGSVASSATANDLSCAEAKARAHHPDAGCYKSSGNHAWLTLPWRTCEEHVYWSHGGFLNLEHYGTVVHCSGWH